jgi:hypothetical protein
MDNLVLVCPTHHRAVHELGYLVAALGRGRFAFYRPDGRWIPDVGEQHTGPEAESIGPAVTADTIVPTWGGQRLDLDLVIGGLAGNVLGRAGHRMADVPYPELDDTLQRAAQWPVGPVRRAA